MKTKIIVIFGGVYSSLGKGIIASSIGRILKECGYKVFMQKMDPYLNVDPGNLSPYQHGEVFVTQDGKECDLDLGNYERFTGQNMTQNSSITSGKMYFDVINDERQGKYDGGTVQVIPHITNKIKEHITKTLKSQKSDFLIIEVGGTVGDMESIPFIEALSQFAAEYGKKNFMSVLCAPLLKLSNGGETKTKPAQHAIRNLGSFGLIPSCLILRSADPVGKDLIEKICLNCHLKKEYVFISRDVPSVYLLPNLLYNQKIQDAIFKYFGIINEKKDNFQRWITFTDRIVKPKNNVIKVALVGKYVELKDAYMSIHESLKFACYENESDLELMWINSEDITRSNVDSILSKADAILVPGGFGIRGIEGKMLAIEYARINKVPFLGICLGMQLALIEFAKNVLKLKNPNSTEFNKKCLPIFYSKEGSMHLGAEKCTLVKNSLAQSIYRKETIDERFRHRYEFNNKYIKAFAEKGMLVSGWCGPKMDIVCCAEYEDHPFFFTCQFHPEFTSKPGSPDPAFDGFIVAAIKSKLTSNE